MTSAKNGSSSPSDMDQYYDSTFSIVSIILNGILSLPLNGSVMWLILRGANTNLASELFPLNLALSEILYSLLSFFLIAYTYTRMQLFLYFQVFIFSLGFIFTARPLFQCFICVECYVGVVHPVFYLRYKPLRYKVTSCCVFWLITLGSCLYFTHTFLNNLYLYGFFIQNLIFLFVMLFCCLATVRALKNPGPGQKVPQRKKGDAAKRRALKIMLLIMISMTINFFLYEAAIPLQCCMGMLSFNRALIICTSLALVSGFIQPLLYLHRNGKLFCFRGL